MSVKHILECPELSDFRKKNGENGDISYFEVCNNNTDELLVCIEYYKNDKIIISQIYDHYPLKTLENIKKVIYKIKEIYTEYLEFSLDNNYFPPSYENDYKKIIKILKEVGFSESSKDNNILEMYFKD